MNFLFIYMQLTLISAIVIPCTIFLWKLIPHLRSVYQIPWRVNCWFCNSNIWVRYNKRNSWTCTKCDQYNGFTKDGDYNRVLCTNTEQVSKRPKNHQTSLPYNGLCKMCNFKQECKVAKLANFIPINEKYYDEEIDSYRMDLEEVYKLCSLCKYMVQRTLRREKKSLIASKLFVVKGSDNSDEKKQEQFRFIKTLINNTSGLIAMILLALVAIECRGTILNHSNLQETTYYNSAETNMCYVQELSINAQSVANTEEALLTDYIGLNGLMQKTLAIIACVLQIIGHFWKINNLQCCIVIDLFWSVILLTSTQQGYDVVDPLITIFIKLFSIQAVGFVYIHLNYDTVIHYITRKNITSKKSEDFANVQKTVLHKQDILFNNEASGGTDVDTSTYNHNRMNSNYFTPYNNRNKFDQSIIISRYFATYNKTSISNQSLRNHRASTPCSTLSWSDASFNSDYSVNTSTLKSFSDTVDARSSFSKYRTYIDIGSECSDLHSSFISIF